MSLVRLLGSRRSLRVRVRPVPRGRHQPRDHLHRREGALLPAHRPSAQPAGQPRPRRPRLPAATSSRVVASSRQAFPAGSSCRLYSSQPICRQSLTYGACAASHPGPIGPVTTFTSAPRTLRFYLGDCSPSSRRSSRQLDRGRRHLAALQPRHQYRSYRDDMPRREYLELDRPSGCARPRASLSPTASLFLNVGAKPTDPWIPLEVAQVARRLLPAAEHDSLGQVDRHRPRGGRRSSRASTATWPSATTSRSTATGS